MMRKYSPLTFALCVVPAILVVDKKATLSSSGNWSRMILLLSATDDCKCHMLLHLLIIANEWTAKFSSVSLANVSLATTIANVSGIIHLAHIK